MNAPIRTAPKVHPATRGIEPDDPMNLHVCEVSGDAGVMLRMLVEEYARMGWSVDAVMNLARDPFYPAFHGLWQWMGEEPLRRQVVEIMNRCGVLKTTTREAPADEDLIALDTSASKFPTERND